MITNVFAPKKKYNQNGQLVSSQQPIQGSGYSSAYSSNASNYKAPTQTVATNRFSTPTKPVVAPRPSPTPTGTVPTRPVAPRVQGPMSRAPQMSVAPRPVANMSVNTGARAPQPPTPRPVPTPTPQPRVDLNANRFNNIQRVGSDREALERKRAQDEMDFIKQRTALSNQQLSEALPAAQNQFNQFKGNTEATIADLLAGGEIQKGQAEDYYGDAQRLAAQTRRETQGQTQKTFANLGTLDSRGEGSFQQATENADSEFNRFTQQNLRAKADKLTEIDATIRQSERDARATITQEEAKMNQLARDIQYALANNSLQEAQELTAAYNQSQSYIYDIQDALAGAQYEFDLAQQELENEIALLNTPGNTKSVEGESKLRAEFFNRTKDNKYNEVAQTYDKILNSTDSAAGDLGLIFSYMKLLDPSSTVREGEFANAQNATGIPSQVMNAYNRAITGKRINPAQREDFRNSALAYVTPVINQQKQAEQYYKQLAEQQGLNPDNIVGGYGVVGSQNNQSTMNNNDPLGLGI